jgi:ATP-dependent Lhr-like helicase
VASWFARRGWAPRAHQLELAAAGAAGEHVLLVAPTGAGKTLAGFLPTLNELAAGDGARRSGSVHTLYISPLKALAADVARNVTGPVSEMALPVRIETRTGDTPASQRQRQRTDPPDILLTTPEQIALFTGMEEARTLFAGLKRIIIDEAHALMPGKRGDLLMLGLAALQRFAPGAQRVGLSATVADEPALARWLVPQGVDEEFIARVVHGPPGTDPQVDLLLSEGRVPWAGHTGRHAIEDVYRAIAGAGVSLVFVNTRFQAELAFQELWKINDLNLPIALHHGSLDAAQRRKVEAAARRGVHLHAGSGDRLGRCGPRDPDGRAQGRRAPGPADRPLQPHAGRALARAAGAHQPLRDAGVPRGPGCHRRPPPRQPRPAQRRTGCAGPACDGPGGGRAVPPRCAV